MARGETSAHRPWCLPQECQLVPGTIEGTHLGPASTLRPAEGGAVLAVRLAETLAGEASQPGVLLAVSGHDLDPDGRLVDRTLDVALSPDEVLALIGLLAGSAAAAQRC